MGTTCSTGKNNDDLVSKLYDANYIRKHDVERAFRAVDRGNYVLEEYMRIAYRDGPWRRGRLHLSAPSIYAEVLGALDIKRGNRFLNVGSGTGYFSTVVGLLLGSTGANHGIELYAEVVDYANEKLDRFLETDTAIDTFDFCEPQFVVGNIFDTIAPVEPIYDRIYVGAEADVHLKRTLWKYYLKVGGIMVLPSDGELMKVIRVNKTKWFCIQLFPVAFNYLEHSKNPGSMVSLPSLEPRPLQEMCVKVLRAALREACEKEHPDLVRTVLKVGATKYVDKKLPTTIPNSNVLRRRTTYRSQMRRNPILTLDSEQNTISLAYDREPVTARQAAGLMNLGDHLAGEFSDADEYSSNYYGVRGRPSGVSYETESRTGEDLSPSTSQASRKRNAEVLQEIESGNLLECGDIRGDVSETENANGRDLLSSGEGPSTSKAMKSDGGDLKLDGNANCGAFRRRDVREIAMDLKNELESEFRVSCDDELDSDFQDFKDKMKRIGELFMEYDAGEYSKDEDDDSWEEMPMSEPVCGDRQFEDETFSGKLTCESARGDLEMDGETCSGELTCESARGDLEMDGETCSGELTRESACGDLEMDGETCSGELTRESACGDLEMYGETCSGKLTSESARGEELMTEYAYGGDSELGIERHEGEPTVRSDNIGDRASTVDRGGEWLMSFRRGDSRLDAVKCVYETIREEAKFMEANEKKSEPGTQGSFPRENNFASCPSNAQFFRMTWEQARNEVKTLVGYKLETSSGPIEGVLPCENGDEGVPLRENGDRFVLPCENGDEGVPLRENDEQGVLSCENGDEGVPLRENDEQGVFSWENGDEGVPLRGNGHQEVHPCENGDEKAPPSENGDNGDLMDKNSFENGDEGAHSSENGDEGAHSSENGDEGVAPCENGDFTSQRRKWYGEGFGGSIANMEWETRSFTDLDAVRASKSYELELISSSRPAYGEEGPSNVEARFNRAFYGEGPSHRWNNLRGLTEMLQRSRDRVNQLSRDGVSPEEMANGDQTANGDRMADDDSGSEEFGSLGRDLGMYDTSGSDCEMKEDEEKKRARAKYAQLVLSETPETKELLNMVGDLNDSDVEFEIFEEIEGSKEVERQQSNQIAGTSERARNPSASVFFPALALATIIYPEAPRQTNRPDVVEIESDADQESDPESDSEDDSDMDVDLDSPPPVTSPIIERSATQEAFEELPEAPFTHRQLMERKIMQLPLSDRYKKIVNFERDLQIDE